MAGSSHVATVSRNLIIWKVRIKEQQQKKSESAWIT